jgi:hypothetical protein
VWAEVGIIGAFSRNLPRGGIHEVALGQGDQSVAQPQQTQNFQMFTRLRHDGIIRRHNEHHKVDPRGAGQHILDETFVAGNVHDPQAELAEIERGKADFDGDPAGLFLRQTIAVNPRESLDERGLAVIDMPSRTKDQVAWHDGAVSVKFNGTENGVQQRLNYSSRSPFPLCKLGQCQSEQVFDDFPCARTLHDYFDHSKELRFVLDGWK